MSRSDPHNIPTSSNGRTAAGIGDLRDRMAILERGSGGVSGGSAIHIGDSVTGDVSGSLLGPITVHQGGNGLVVFDPSADPLLGYVQGNGTLNSSATGAITYFALGQTAALDGRSTVSGATNRDNNRIRIKHSTGYVNTTNGLRGDATNVEDALRGEHSLFRDVLSIHTDHNSLGGLVGYESQIQNVTFPTGASAPNNYSESNNFIGYIGLPGSGGIANKGAYATNLETFMRTQSDADVSGKGGPGQFNGVQIIIQERNTYASYNSAIFAASSPRINSGAVGLRIFPYGDPATGHQPMGTGIYLDGPSGFIRGLVLRKASVDAFCLDAAGGIGVRTTVDQTHNTSGFPAAVNIGWSAPGVASTVAADGIDYGGHVQIYSTATGRLRVEATTGASRFAIGSAQAAQAAQFLFLDAGTEKWRISKSSSSTAPQLVFTESLSSPAVNVLQLFPQNAVNYGGKLTNIQNAAGSTSGGFPGFDVTSTLDNIVQTSGFIPAGGGISQHLTVGGTTAIKGSALGYQSHVDLQRVSDAQCEFAHYFGYVADGTTTGAIHPRVWGMDTGVYGAIGEQQQVLANAVFHIGNYYDGSPSLTDSVGATITTRWSAGPGNDIHHDVAETYPVNVGLAVVGNSRSDQQGIGFRTGIRVGGGRVPWWDNAGDNTSRIDQGISVQDYMAGGIKIWKRANWTATGMTGNAVSPIIVTVSGGHSLTTGDQVNITGTVGNTAANGTWTVTVTSSTQFSLNTSTGNGTWTSGGLIVRTGPSVSLGWGYDGLASVNPWNGIDYAGEFKAYRSASNTWNLDVTPGTTGASIGQGLSAALAVGSASSATAGNFLRGGGGIFVNRATGTTAPFFQGWRNNTGETVPRIELLNLSGGTKILWSDGTTQDNSIARGTSGSITNGLIFAGNGWNFGTGFQLDSAGKALNGLAFIDTSAAQSISAGATNGTRFGLTGDKIAVLGAAPIVRQTFGAATAGGTYGATEQTMLQKCYDALRNFGFGT